MDSLLSAYSTASDDEDDSLARPIPMRPDFPPAKWAKPEYPNPKPRFVPSYRASPSSNFPTEAPIPGRYISKRERAALASGGTVADPNPPSLPSKSPVDALKDTISERALKRRQARHEGSSQVPKKSTFGILGPKRPAQKTLALSSLKKKTMPSKEDTPTPLAQVEASTQESSTSLSLDSNPSQEQVTPQVEVSNCSRMIYTISWEVYEDSSLEEVSRPLVEALALPKSRKERFEKSLSSTRVADADADANAMFKHIAQIGDLYWHLNKAQEYHLSQISALEAKLKKSEEAKEKHFQAMCVASKHNQENLQEIAKLKKENQELQASHKNEVNEIQASHKSEVRSFACCTRKSLNPLKRRVEIPPSWSSLILKTTRITWKSILYTIALAPSLRIW